MTTSRWPAGRPAERLTRASRARARSGRDRPDPGRTDEAANWVGRTAPAYGSKLRPYDGHLNCPDGGSASLVSDYLADAYDWPGASPTARSALRKYLARAAAHGIRELEGLEYERRLDVRIDPIDLPTRGQILAHRAGQATFVGSRDGVEYAVLSFERGGDRRTWLFRGYTLCGGLELGQVKRPSGR